MNFTASAALRRRRGLPSMDLAADVEPLNPVDVPQEYTDEPLKVITIPVGPGEEPVVGDDVPAETDDSAAFNAAEDADRRGRLSSGLELAGRQLVAGITGTELGKGLAAPEPTLPGVISAAKLRRQALIDALERKQRGAVGAATLRKTEAETERIQRGDDMSEYQRALIAKAVVDQRLRESANERAEKKLTTDTARAIAKDAAAQKAEDLKTSSTGIPLAKDLGEYRPKPGTALRDVDASKLRDQTAAYAKAVKGMDDLGGAIDAYVKSTNLATRNNMLAKVAGTAAAITAAHGGGAMADQEFLRVAQAMGADPTTLAGLQAVMLSFMGSPNAAASMLNMLKSGRQSMVAMSDGVAGAYNYDRHPPMTPTKADAPSKTTPASPGDGFERMSVKGRHGWYNPRTKQFRAD